MSYDKPVARMRLLNEAYAELKSLDPQTCISKNFVRQLAISGKIPVVQVGKRRLINMDGLLDYLNTHIESEPETEGYGRVEYQNSSIVKAIKALLKDSPEKRWDGTATDLLSAGKRVTGSYVAPTSQRVGIELNKLGEALYKYDKIIYEPTPNGNSGRVYHFYYEEYFEVEEPEENEDYECVDF